MLIATIPMGEFVSNCLNSILPISIFLLSKIVPRYKIPYEISNNLEKNKFGLLLFLRVKTACGCLYLPYLPLVSYVRYDAASLANHDQGDPETLVCLSGLYEGR